MWIKPYRSQKWFWEWLLWPNEKFSKTYFGKSMENVRKHRDIGLVTSDKRRGCLASEPKYQATNCSLENSLAMKTNKAKVKMDKPIYLGLFRHK